MKAIGYIRVSTEEQAKEGVSLEAQAKAVQAYAEMRGIKLVDIVVDAGVSAGKPLHDRKGGLVVRTAVRRKYVDAVITFKLDRLFRDCAECLTVIGNWDKVGVSLHLVDLGGQAIDTATAMGRFFLTVMAGAAELERNLIRERTSTAMQHMRENGAYTGGRPPYGYELRDGELVENEREQLIVRAAKRMRELGKSLREIGARLIELGYLPRTGGEWHASQVRQLVAA